MVFLALLEIFAVSFSMIFFTFQILIPLWNGTELFPTFRRKNRVLDQELRNVKTDLESIEEKEKIEELKLKIKKKGDKR